MLFSFLFFFVVVVFLFFVCLFVVVVVLFVFFQLFILPETVTVDVSTTFLPQSLLHTLAVTDPDGDPMTCTATPPAGYTVDSELFRHLKLA